jgi:hypothetical protein
VGFGDFASDLNNSGFWAWQARRNHPPPLWTKALKTEDQYHVEHLHLYGCMNVGHVIATYLIVRPAAISPVSPAFRAYGDHREESQATCKR